MNLPSFDPKEISRRVIELTMTLSAISATLILSAGLIVAAYLSLRMLFIVIRTLESQFRQGGL